MLVKMLTSIAGDDHDYRHGQIVDLPKKTAQAWIEAGTAVKVEGAEALTAARDDLVKEVAALKAEVAALKSDNERLALELAAARNPAPAAA